MELHHDIETESRVVKFLVKRLKFLKSRNIKKIIAITRGVKDEFLKNDYIIDNKILVLPSGSSIKENFKFKELFLWHQTSEKGISPALIKLTFCCFSNIQ